jgi:hypothetical protein
MTDVTDVDVERRKEREKKKGQELKKNIRRKGKCQSIQRAVSSAP